MLNKGYINNTGFKAVPCNIIEKIFEARDNILANCSRYTREDYEDLYKDNFENWDSDDYTLGECVSFLKNYSDGDCKVIDTDIYIYTSEHYLAETGKYKGVCKLPNGAEIVVFKVCGEESGFSMCQVLYYDGNTLRILTPYQGNTVNIATKTHLGDEQYTKKDVLKSDFFRKVYAEGIDTDFDEDAFGRYCVFIGLIEKEEDVENLDRCIFDVDWDVVCEEIERVLC